jgi:hypothetical protein
MTQHLAEIAINGARRWLMRGDMAQVRSPEGFRSCALLRDGLDIHGSLAIDIRRDVEGHLLLLL